MEVLSLKTLTEQLNAIPMGLSQQKSCIDLVYQTESRAPQKASNTA